ncbi:predicted protein [Histoplasma capsulatum G186AR]|uniref:Uncharacterized protein n=1 Tax=Ajellomyces capsulatus (strain G186AR / H82 / ATCC MYA-2454 / RMSCC 2432) TaxID=447093 RepID=C0NQY2_AJECG|nr:uncharacterized protein HCBG_05412 [Histoplasma capsulatum G186AR]EEH06096.1 predicted protein [Histoplasma capsulatum G186AR]
MSWTLPHILQLQGYNKGHETRTRTRTRTQSTPTPTPPNPSSAGFGRHPQVDIEDRPEAAGGRPDEREIASGTLELESMVMGDERTLVNLSEDEGDYARQTVPDLFPPSEVNCGKTCENMLNHLMRNTLR